MLRLDVESDPGRVMHPARQPFVNTAGASRNLGLRTP
jgi:hypothetical protein